MNVTAQQVRLASRPSGLPGPETWDYAEQELPPPGPGEVTIRVELLSLDPAMRGRMRETRSYAPPWELDAVVPTLGIGEVISSEADDLPIGTKVRGMLAAADHVVLPADTLTAVDLDVAPAQTWLGALGMTGWTAYFGLLDVGRPAEGDTVVVSGAAGAVGSVVGQVAKLKGCRVIGIAGGPEKCAWLTDELGFDAAIDYQADDVGAGLKRLAPDGVDVFFDNVGGDILDAVLANLGLGARIAVCGAISQYNAGQYQGPRNYMMLLVTRSRMEGFLVTDYVERFGEATAELAGWIGDGRLKTRETVVDGAVADFGPTMLRLFTGENTGKLLLRLAN